MLLTRVLGVFLWFAPYEGVIDGNVAIIYELKALLVVAD
jgi:hypothetical protein